MDPIGKIVLFTLAGAFIGLVLGSVVASRVDSQAIDLSIA